MYCNLSITNFVSSKSQRVFCKERLHLIPNPYRIAGTREALECGLAGRYIQSRTKGESKCCQGHQLYCNSSGENEQDCVGRGRTGRIEHSALGKGCESAAGGQADPHTSRVEAWRMVASLATTGNKSRRPDEKK